MKAALVGVLFWHERHTNETTMISKREENDTETVRDGRTQAMNAENVMNRGETERRKEVCLESGNGPGSERGEHCP